MLKIICVCLGNICRSPVAEAILRKNFITAGYREFIDFEVSSAGTGNWHINQQPDSRSSQICQQHGIDISAHRGKQLTYEDANYFDLILAMDKMNVFIIKNMVATNNQQKIHLFDFPREVSDPYHMSNESFQDMYQNLVRASAVWLRELEHKLENRK